MTTYCTKCGHKVQDEAAFCANCGSPIAEPKFPKRQSSSSVICPVCHKDDMLRKVASIAASGTASTVAQGQSLGFAGDDLAVISTRTSGKSQTQLSIQLSPPSKPEYVTTGRLFWLLPLMLGPLSLFFTLSIDSLEAGGGNLLCYAPSIIITGIGLVSYRSFRREKKLFEDEEIPLWEQSISKWKKLYYCGRDDIVFDPSTGRYVDSENMNWLIPFRE